MPDNGLTLRAACFFVLAEQSSRLEWWLDALFWELSALPVVETAHHLPAMAAAVRNIVVRDCPWTSILEPVASQPLPAVLSPEAVPWHTRLVAAWEIHRASNNAELQNLARLALVRLDGCGMPDGQERPSRLAEWLAEAQKIASGEWRVVDGQWEVASGPGDRKKYRTWRTDGRNWVCYFWDAYHELEDLAALAAWRPAPGVITPPETLQDWVDFWLEVGRSDDPMKKGIAAIALLNLPEADLRAASIPPMPAAELLQQLSRAIQFAAERENYLSLLDWQPIEGTAWPVAEVRTLARSWLEATRHEKWARRCAAWRQLIRWDRAGRLALCGIDLLPELVQAVPTEESSLVLWAMAQWVPGREHFTTPGTPGRRSQLRQLESVWERHRTSGDVWTDVPAWLTRIRLYQAGLASASPESFINAYLSHLAGKCNRRVLFTLAQWSPGADAPERWHRDWHKSWQERLLNQEKPIRQVAAWALLRQFLDEEHGRSLRGVALALWRAGVKVSSEARHILGAAFARLQEVQARLAAGEAPDFEKVPVPPAERHRPPLALPPGRIAGGEWQMENEKWKMENEEWKMKHQEATPKPNARLGTDSPFSRGGF